MTSESEKIKNIQITNIDLTLTKDDKKALEQAEEDLILGKTKRIA